VKPSQWFCVVFRIIYAAAIDQGSAKSPGSKTPTEDGGEKASESICIEACGIYQGHDDMVEDV
ncbi:hypothetical protein MKW92_029816, partial [Papaver armeniacum]